MSLYDIPLTTLAGKSATLAEHRGEVLLAVNVASKCGFTPQYEGLEKLHETYAARGFAVLGFPCNQFLFQEKGSADEIAQFCSLTYGVTFPMFAKLNVRGRQQHPLYAQLTNGDGRGGGVRWNFEKFLISRDGEVIAHWRSTTTPEDPAVTSAIEAALG
jgi:glutathione peroxidase